MRKLITAHQAIVALRGVVAEAGRDYRYEKIGGECRYVHNGEPSCGVGRVLVRLGLPIAELAKYEGLSALGLGSYLTNNCEKRGLPLLLAEDASKVLDEFQHNQDQAAPWGDALDAAENEFRSLATATA